MARRRKKHSPNKRRTQRSAQAARRDTPELQQARALWAANRFPQALALFDKALRKTPDNPIALLDAARAYGARFEIDRAERLLERFLSIAGDKPGNLHLAGQSYRMIYRPRQATECYQQALAMTRDLPDTHLELAILYERRHKLDAAVQHIDECLTLRPSYVEAKLVRARLLRRGGHLASATEVFNELAHSAAHWLVTSQSFAELARIYENDGDCDRAMNTMIACKDILEANSRQLQHESVRSYQHTQHLAQALTREDFERWQEASAVASGGERLAFLTGSPRSGTTLLESVLDAHPEIVCADELPAFPRYIYPALLEVSGASLLAPNDFNSVPAARLERERQRYMKYMELALGEEIGERVHVDKNPSILTLVPGMVRLFPAGRLLIALRDPRDVIVSCFMCYLPLNTVSVNYLTLDKTVTRFCQDIDAWLKYRELLVNAWHEVKYEDMVADFDNTTRECLEFLGVRWHDTVLDYRQRVRDKAVNSPTYEEVAKPIYQSSVGRWKRFEKYLQPYLEQLAKYLKILRY